MKLQPDQIIGGPCICSFCQVHVDCYHANCITIGEGSGGGGGLGWGAPTNGQWEHRGHTSNSLRICNVTLLIMYV